MSNFLYFKAFIKKDFAKTSFTPLRFKSQNFIKKSQTINFENYIFFFQKLF